MHSSCQRGNDSNSWNSILEVLDEKLQLGLLDHLKRITSYHFEDSTLTIEAGNQVDFAYLSRAEMFHQLEIFVKDRCKVDKILITEPENTEA